ncbi:MAG: cytochrome c oxidase subunit II, partial [Planctomycetota bacterium]
FAIWKFDHRRNPNEKALYIHHNTKLEVVWSVIPAIILIVLAIVQMEAWEQNKMDRPTVSMGGVEVPAPPIVMVKAKRFGWEFYYAGKDGRVETADDVYVENLLVLPANEDVVLQLESRDVIHSFFVPELRIKQDIVPGMTQFSWFNSRKICDVEIICTELCGWGHYKMKGLLKLVSRQEFDQWLEEQSAEYLPELKSADSEPITP